MALLDPDAARRARRTIIRELRRMDRRLEREDQRTFQAGVVLMSIFMVGSNVEAVSELSGQSHRFVKGILRRCRKQGILRGQVLRVNWERENSGNLSVLLDSMVAGGDIDRASNPKRVAAQKRQQAHPAAVRPRKPRQSRAAVGPFCPVVRPRRDADDYYKANAQTHALVEARKKL